MSYTLSRMLWRKTACTRFLLHISCQICLILATGPLILTCRTVCRSMEQRHHSERQLMYRSVSFCLRFWECPMSLDKDPSDRWIRGFRISELSLFIRRSIWAITSNKTVFAIIWGIYLSRVLCFDSIWKWKVQDIKTWYLHIKTHYLQKNFVIVLCVG